MADVAVQNPATGEMRMVAEEDAPAFTQQTGWIAPDAAAREHGAKMLESGSTGDQALAAGETAVRTATLGLVPGLAKGWKQRAEVQAEEHPYVRMAAQGVGALAPALATGGLAGAAAEGLELGGGVARAAAGIGENFAGATAAEVEDARAQTRDVSVGNIMLYGLGGEIVGRALPAAIGMGAGRVRRALTAAEEVSGEGIPSALAGAEARSVESEARIARDLPEGPERQAALQRTAKEQYENLAVDGADTVEKFSRDAEGMTGGKRVNERLRQAMPDESPVQQNWFTEQKRALSDEYLSVNGKPMAPDPASEYALEAAKRRIRGVAEKTGNDELAALAGEAKEPSAAARGLPPEVKKAINERTMGADLEDITRWAKDPEALRSGHGFEPPKATAPLELGAYEKDVRNVIRPGLRRMDQAGSIADQYVAARDMASQLEAIGARVGKDDTLAPGVRDGILESIQGRAKALRTGLTDESLFGGAAKLESDLSRGAEKMQSGLDQIGALSDPSKMRRFLQSDRVDRMAMGRKLDEALEGAEDLLATHETNGTLDAKQITEQRSRIRDLRDARKFADEIQVAQAAGKAPAAPESTGGLGGMIGEKVGDILKEHLLHEVPFVGKAMRMARLAQRLTGIDQAARTATKQTARSLAGSLGGAAAGNAGKAIAGQVAGAVERGAGAVTSGAAGVPALTALERFAGDYSGPEESFAAKRKLLDQHTVAPDALFDAIGSSMEDLPQLNPQLFQQVAARTAQNVRYVQANLPPGIKTTLMYPTGTPPAQSQLRDFAVVWNTTMDPHSVLEDIQKGTATGLQMKTLREAHPDIYEQLRGDMVEQIGQNFRNVPLSTKLQMDILFNADGIAGPFFSSKAAGYIGQANKELLARGGKAPPPAQGSLDKLSSTSGPAGLGAIQSSVTNKGAGV